MTPCPVNLQGELAAQSVPPRSRRFIHPDAQERVYTQAGDGFGVVLVNGVAAGAWTARFSRERMEVELDTFEPPGARIERTVTERFEAIAALLDARALSLDRSFDR